MGIVKLEEFINVEWSATSKLIHHFDKSSSSIEAKFTFLIEHHRSRIRGGSISIAICQYPHPVTPHRIQAVGLSQGERSNHSAKSCFIWVDPLILSVSYYRSQSRVRVLLPGANCRRFRYTASRNKLFVFDHLSKENTGNLVWCIWYILRFSIPQDVSIRSENLYGDLTIKYKIT